jgi:hypothetical protein
MRSLNLDQLGGCQQSRSRLTNCFASKSLAAKELNLTRMECSHDGHRYCSVDGYRLRDGLRRRSVSVRKEFRRRCQQFAICRAVASSLVPRRFSGLSGKYRTRAITA